MKKILALLVLQVAGLCAIHAQGCSDAGLCQLGLLGSGPLYTADSMRHRLGVSAQLALGEEETRIAIPRLEYTRYFKKGSSLEIQGAYYLVSGDLGDYHGLGDVTLNYQFRPWTLGEAWKMQVSLGARAALGQADEETPRGHALPMPYQSNLGTTDAIAGVHLTFKNFLHISAGVQQPVYQYNQNGYNAAVVLDAEPGYRDYFISRELKRKGDAMLRIEGIWTKNKWSLGGGPLLIYHLGQDQAIDIYGDEVSLEGSQGLTLNLAARIGYQGRHIAFGVAGGFPLLVRDYRPDGLTRAFSLLPSLSFLF